MVKWDEMYAADYPTYALADNLSDYYKDVRGVRPRHIDRADRSAIIAELQHLEDCMETQKSTFEGREQLRADGWVIPETDPQLKAVADANAAEREAAEQAHHYLD